MEKTQRYSTNYLDLKLIQVYTPLFVKSYTTIPKFLFLQEKKRGPCQTALELTQITSRTVIQHWRWSLSLVSVLHNFQIPWGGAVTSDRTAVPKWDILRILELVDVGRTIQICKARMAVISLSYLNLAVLVLGVLCFLSL